MTSVPYAEVIGDPIDHSLSPIIHAFWLEQLQLEGDYRRTRVTRGELADYLAGRRSDPLWRGCNVTMPLKLDALAAADEAGDRAIGTGAANLLVPRGNRLIAGNTDVGGVSALLGRLVDGGAAMGTVTVIGSGGAARAALMALHLLGIDDVRIQSRNLAEAYKLAIQFRVTQPPRPFETPVDSDGLINATPCGMDGKPPLDHRLDAMPADGWVLDFVTASRPTALLERASERRLRTVDGIAMLVEQAAESFSALWGATAPRNRDDTLFERLRA